MRSREKAEASNLRMPSSLHLRAALFIRRCTNLPQRIKGRFQAFLGQKEFLAEMCLGSSWLDCAYPSHRQFLMKRPQTAYANLKAFSVLCLDSPLGIHGNTRLTGRRSVFHSPAPPMYRTAVSCLGLAENLCIALDVLPC